tara:strand:+ start:300 stop:968 length:669 start_codon:yes stop_codon:yes gene_type:complete
MKKTIHEDAPANAMGGNFATGQVGDAGNIAGMSAPLGCPAPLTTRSGECFNKRQIINRNQQEKISQIIQILMGRTFPKEELNEKLSTLSIAAKATTEKGIAAIGDKATANPPGQIAPLSKTQPKIVSGVNGLSTPPATIGRVVGDLQAAKNRFSRLNVDPARAATDPAYLYKTKNLVGQADARNTTLGTEMRVFFRKAEDDSTTDELVTKAVSDHFNNKRII